MTKYDKNDTILYVNRECEGGKRGYACRAENETGR